MSTYYKLDENHNAVACTMEEFSKTHEKQMRVKEDTLKGLWVSTVFLGLNHNFADDDGPPIVFETMVFALKEDGNVNFRDLYGARYCTYEESLEGHQKAVDMVVNGKITRKGYDQK